MSNKKRSVVSGQSSASDDGGPRIEALMKIFERMLDFEEEVRTGARVMTETGSILVRPPSKTDEEIIYAQDD